MAVRCGARHYEARARLELARALLAGSVPNQLEQAQAELTRASSIVDALGLYAYSPQVRGERARLALTPGDQPAYVRDLQDARRMFVEVSAPG